MKYMKRLLVYSFLVFGFSALAGAQSVTTSDSIATDSLNLGVITRLDSIDLPQGLIMSEDEIINAPANKGLVPGNGETRQLSLTDQQIVERLSRIPTTIDLPFNNITREYIDTYSNRRRNSVSVMLGSSNFYMPIFEEALEKYGLPLELRYLPVIESALVPTATSRVGAGGLWQFMLTTARQYGLEVNTLVDERRDPLKSSDAAARLLRDLYNMFGDWGLALASYNCGPGNVTKAIARAGNPEVKDFWTIYNYLPRETRGYVPAFIAATYIMTYYCDHGITPMEATLPQESDTIVVSKEVKFGQIANKCSNLSVDVLRALNPQYRRDIIPANYAVRLPSANIEEFILLEDSIYGSTPQTIVTNIPNVQTSKSTAAKKKTASTKKSRSKTVTVKSGDSLGRIASRNGTTVAKLRRLNGIKGDMIRPGQKIRVR